MSETKRVGITIQTRGYEIYIGDSSGKIGEFVGHTPVTFYIEPKEEKGTLGFKKYITVKKDGEVVKGCLGASFILHKGSEIGDCWSVQEIFPPSGGIFIPHKGTETSLAFDIDDKRDYGWIYFAGEADRIEVYIDGEHRGVILDLYLTIYLAPGTYRVEQEAAGAHCYADQYYYKGTPYYTTEIAIKAGEETIVDIDMYNHPLDPPPQYILDAAIRHLQELGWVQLPSEWACCDACRKCVFTEEWCYTNNVPEVCDYERATHYWLVSHPGFVFPETEICKVTINAPEYWLAVSTQQGVTVPKSAMPAVFNCASICVGKDEYECTRYITLASTKGVLCDDAKLVLRKVGLGSWGINRERSSSFIAAFDISSSPATLELTMLSQEADELDRLTDMVLAYKGKKEIGFMPSLDDIIALVRIVYKHRGNEG